MTTEIIAAGGSEKDGEIIVRNAEGKVLIHIFGKSSDVLVGGEVATGEIALRGHRTITLPFCIAQKYAAYTGDNCPLNRNCLIIPRLVMNYVHWGSDAEDKRTQ